MKNLWADNSRDENDDSKFGPLPAVVGLIVLYAIVAVAIYLAFK